MGKAAVDFFHYIKHEEKESLKVWKNLISNPEKLCPFTHKQEGETLLCYSIHPSIKVINEFLEKYLELFSYLEVDTDELEHLRDLISEIKNPLSNKNVEMFKDNANRIERFVGYYTKGFFEKSKKFTCLESRRIGESLECFKSNCYYASSILIVS